MIKMNSISGIACYVVDLETTARFYEVLGFRVGNKEDNCLTVYVNWFWIKFIQDDDEAPKEIAAEAKIAGKGKGVFTCIKVDDVDEFYEYVISNGLEPSSEPKSMKSGSREFIICDPDGYKLAFFSRK